MPIDFTAFAYIGPGAGLSLASALVGLFAAVGASSGFLVLYPLRAFFRRRRDAKVAVTTEDSTAGA